MRDLTDSKVLGWFTERLLEEGLATQRELGRTREVAISLGLLGQVALARSDLDTAQARFEEGLSMQDGADDLTHSAWRLGQLGQVAAARGDLVASRRLLEQGLATDPAVPSRTPAMLLQLAQVALDEGDIEEAARLCAQGLRLSHEMAIPLNIAEGLKTFAAIASIRGQARQALRLAAAAGALLDSLGMSSIPDDQHWFDQLLEPAHNALNGDARALATAQGRAMTVEQAVADALDGFQHGTALLP